MTQNSQPLPPLAVPRIDIGDQEPFFGDLLGRKQLAQRLTSHLDRLKTGAVLAIDAPWGEGKSWFGRNWEKHLRQEGHQVVFIDAFEQDFVEDPFMLLAAEIADVLDNNDGAAKTLREKAVGVMKAIMPIGTKALINLAGRVTMGSADLSEDLKEVAESASDGTADAASQWVEKKLEDHAQEKASVKHFKDVLSSFSATQEKPVVIFIDELDRCRPDFAVRMIERVKHFFDVPNVIFVLLLNRTQLEAAVHGVYGQEVDASAYLGKFVHFFLRLPKQRSLDAPLRDHNIQYCHAVAQQMGIPSNEDTHNFAEAFGIFSNLKGLSLRDIERGYTLFSLALPIGRSAPFLSWLIALKISEPVLFADILADKADAHLSAVKMLDALSTRLTRFWVLQPLRELHHAHSTGSWDASVLSDDTQHLLRSLGTWSLRPSDFLPWHAKRIDLAID